ncbi:MAG: hypothetical protein ACOVLE_07685, partial [Pirellula staleyi]
MKLGSLNILAAIPSGVNQRGTDNGRARLLPSYLRTKRAASSAGASHSRCRTPDVALPMSHSRCRTPDVALP